MEENKVTEEKKDWISDEEKKAINDSLNVWFDKKVKEAATLLYSTFKSSKTRNKSSFRDSVNILISASLKRGMELQRELEYQFNAELVSLKQKKEQVKD